MNRTKAPYSDSAELYSTVHTTEQNRERRKEFTGGKSGLNRNLMDGLGGNGYRTVNRTANRYLTSQLTSHEMGQAFFEQTDA